MDANEQAVVVSFLQLYVQDAARGEPRGLASYQARYPGYEAAIASEFERLTAASVAVTAAPPAVTPPVAGAPEPIAAALAAIRAVTSSQKRYTPGREVGRGGMGVVLRAFDSLLHRNVAMKVMPLPPGVTTDTISTLDPVAVHRFLEEAKVTGGLDHPGIVPVHELGLDAEGHLFFTMSLISGDDFRTIVARVHAGDPEWSSTRAVTALLRAAEAVAFAHSMGVVHRDLKPANIMVGRFGETYVMDWGLAHVSGQSDSRREPGAAVPGADDSPLATRIGDVVGTPAYMPPEQARGDIAAMGPHSDVYSLGAVLYHLLVGEAPYANADRGSGVRDVLAMVRAGPPAPLLRRARHAPPELAAICNQAMARDPSQRYPSMLEMAEDLRAYLETRVVHAYASGAFAELRKWVARNRIAAAASLVALLTLCIGLFVSLRATGRADTQTRLAEVQSQLAQGNFELAFAAAEDLLATVAFDDLRTIPGADPIRRRIAEKALPYFERLLTLRGDDPAIRQRIALTHRRLGELHEELGRYDQALLQFDAAERDYRELVADDPENDVLRGERGAAGLAEARVRWRMGQLPAAIARVADLVPTLEQLTARAPPGSTAAIKLLRDQATAHSLLANCLFAQQDFAAALPHRQQALRLAQSTLAPQRGASGAESVGTAHGNLALTLMMLGHDPEAEEQFGQAAQVYRAALELHADDRILRYGLARNLAYRAMVAARLRHPDVAESGYAEAVRMLRGLVRDFPHDPDYRGELGGALCNWSDLPRLGGDRSLFWRRIDESVQELHRAIELSPDHRAFRGYLRHGYDRVLFMLVQEGRHQDAAARAAESLRDLGTGSDQLEAARCLAQCADLAARDPALDPEARSAVASSYAERAVAMLAAAHRLGASLESVDTDQRFAAVRNRADWLALRQQAQGNGR